MIKIREACQILGIGHPDEPNDKDKSKAREVLNYFGVHTAEEPLPDGKFGKPAKTYARNQVEAIAAFKLPNPAY